MSDFMITRRGGAAAGSAPVFTYTGTYAFINDGDKNWRIRLLTSGTLRFSKLGNAANGVDAFLVGAGGGGEPQGLGSAGGGGYTLTTSNLVQNATNYTVVIGAGVAGQDGGSTSAFGATAAGGKAGNGERGGDGGSGGGAWAAGTGGSDGSNGGTGTRAIGGAGQGTTTREFGEASGALYSGGGGGGYGGNNSTTPGGAGGGGAGGQATVLDTHIDTSYRAIDGEINTGGGGGGTSHGAVAHATAGGSGIVVIRNHRA